MRDENMRIICCISISYVVCSGGHNVAFFQFTPSLVTSVCLTEQNDEILQACARVLSVLSERSCEMCPASLCQQSVSQGDSGFSSLLN